MRGCRGILGTFFALTLVVFFSVSHAADSQQKATDQRATDPGATNKDAPPPLEKSFFDYSFGLRGRSYPFGLSPDGTVGYNFAFWGDPAKSPLYGYIRPAFQGNATPVSGNFRPQITIAPVTLVSLTVGQSWGRTLVNPLGYDCTVLDCNSWVKNSFLQISLVGGYSKFFVGYSLDRYFYEPGTPGINLPDFRDALALSPYNEIKSISMWRFGVRDFYNWTVGILLQNSTLSVNSGRQDSQLLFGQRTWGRWALQVGAGRFASTDFGTGATFVLGGVWNGRGRLGF